MNNHFLKIITCLCILMLCASPSFAQFNFGASSDGENEGEKVEITADQIEYDNNKNMVVGRGNVVIIHGTDRLVADYAEVYHDTKEATAEGHVILFQGDNQLRGDTCHYNFETNVGDFPDGAYRADPIFGDADEIQQISQDKARLENGFLTTCDLGFRPHYGVAAKKVTIVFDQKIVASNCKIKVLDKTVMWVPYVHIPLNMEKPPFSIKPGYSSDWGGYVLTKKSFNVNKNINGTAHYDYRYKRGHAGGLDAGYDYGKWGFGALKSYYAHDEKAPNFALADPESGDITDGRYRFKWQHRTDIDDYTNLIVEYNKLHDEFFLNDFFESEYRAEADPETYAVFTHNRENYGILVNVEKRANHFYDTLEKLPEVRFTWNTQEIMDTNIYYESEASGISFNNKRARSSIDDDVVRLDFYNKVSYPVKFFQYNFVPYLYSRHDYYSKNAAGKEDITRAAYGNGIDINTRYFRVYDVVSDAFGVEINKMRHLLEPRIAYDSTREVSVPKDTLFQLDEIDAEDDFDEVTFGLRNKLQTKREVDGKMQRVDLFALDNTINYEFNREEAGGSLWLTFKTEVEARPYSWLLLHHENVWDIARDTFTSADFDIEIEPDEKWHFYLSHRYIDDRIQGDDDEASCLVTFDTDYTINDLWKVGGYVRHEYDDARTEEIELRFERDLHCWLFEFGINRRHNSGDEKEYELFFNLQMKAFPDIEAESGNRSAYSRGRFGNLISGSTQ